MPIKLSTTLAKIDLIENIENRQLVKQYNKYMNSIDASERHQNNNLKVIISYVNFLDNYLFVKYTKL